MSKVYLDDMGRVVEDGFVQFDSLENAASWACMVRRLVVKPPILPFLPNTLRFINAIIDLCGEEMMTAVALANMDRAE